MSRTKSPTAKKLFTMIVMIMATIPEANKMYPRSNSNHATIVRVFSTTASTCMALVLIVALPPLISKYKGTRTAKEPKNIDFTVESKPWTEEELRDFRMLMTKLKVKNATKKSRIINAKKKKKALA